MLHESEATRNKTERNEIERELGRLGHILGASWVRLGHLEHVLGVS